MVDIRAITEGLEQAEDGIWYSVAQGQRVSYPDDGHEACFALEEASFWFRHRNDCIVHAVQAYPPPAPGTIVDIGGGNGFVALGLSRAGCDVALLEPGPRGAANARRRGLDAVICASTDSAGFALNSLPAIGLFDVVEHVADDRAFLSQCRALLQPGGRLYLTVPAYGWLWSQEDVAAGHFRRYSLGSIEALLEASGFALDFSSYIFRFLPLPIALMRALPYRLGRASAPRSAARGGRDHVVGGSPLLRALLDGLLRSEIRRIDCGRAMHFGGSCLVVAHRH